MSANAPAAKPPVVLVESPAEGVRLLRINRPEARNALNMEVRIELARLITAFNADPEVRSIILAGDAKSFAAGADIKERAQIGIVGKMQSDLDKHKVSHTVSTSAKPIIAAVRGYALGGGFETALMCDIIVAGESAQFGLPELKLGVIPGSGGTQRFARGAGKHRALYHLLTATFMSAREEIGRAHV